MIAMLAECGLIFEVRPGVTEAPVASGLTRFNVAALNQARSSSLPPPCPPITGPSCN